MHSTADPNKQQPCADDLNLNLPKRSTFPFGKCMICKDEASGFHYGVATCEGCKVILISDHVVAFLLVQW